MLEAGLTVNVQGIAGAVVTIYDSARIGNCQSDCRSDAARASRSSRRLAIRAVFSDREVLNVSSTRTNNI